MSEEVKEEIESPPPYEGPMLLPMTDSSLSKIPEPVDLEKEDLKQLKADLLESMYHFGGIGLSANQVGIDKKFFVLGSELVTDEEENKFEKSFFNPTLLTVSEEEESIKEGCLSYPGLWLMVKRPVQCTIKYYNSDGEEIVETYEGVSARVILHEYDHMLGMNFTQRVSKLKLERGLKAAEKKFKKHQRRMARLLGI